jgi:hypothetical protein
MLGRIALHEMLCCRSALLRADVVLVASHYNENPCGVRPSAVCRHAVSQVSTPSGDPSALAKAYEWAYRIMVVSLEMVLPGLAGYWIDKRLGTVCLFLVIGLTAGSVVGMRQLMQLARQSTKRNGSDR